MIKKAKFYLLFIFLFLIPGCWKSVPKLVIINVLDKGLYNDCHIKGSINVPIDCLAWCKNNLNKESEIIIYCSDYKCTTSEYAAQKLLSWGFKNVGVYEGGMAEWYQYSQKEPQRFRCQGSCKQSYLTRKVEKIGSPENPEIKIISYEELADKIEKTNSAGS